jgi:hypothetical protein
VAMNEWNESGNKAEYVSETDIENIYHEKYLKDVQCWWGKL